MYTVCTASWLQVMAEIMLMAESCCGTRTHCCARAADKPCHVMEHNELGLAMAAHLVACHAQRVHHAWLGILGHVEGGAIRPLCLRGLRLGVGHWIIRLGVGHWIIRHGLWGRVVIGSGVQ